jgi:hypothetical protein
VIISTSLNKDTKLSDVHPFDTTIESNVNAFLVKDKNLDYIRNTAGLGNATKELYAYQLLFNQNSNVMKKYFGDKISISFIAMTEDIVTRLSLLPMHEIKKGNNCFAVIFPYYKDILGTTGSAEFFKVDSNNGVLKLINLRNFDTAYAKRSTPSKVIEFSIEVGL